MFPLARISPDEASRLRGLVFDLDDTLLDHGLLTGPAYAALLRARDAGLQLVLATGRPAGWGEVLARMWPVDGAVAENGAIAFRREGAGVRALLRSTDHELDERRTRVLALAAAMRETFGAEPADDVRLRRTDFTFDVGESRREPPERVAAMVAFARERGARTTVSSVHLHISFEGDDKATGVLAFLSSALGVDPTEARARYAFVGDSGNDAACFAAFSTTIGVANIGPYARLLSVPPRYLTAASRGAGFAELIDALVDARRAAA